MKLPVYTDEQLDELERNSDSNFEPKPGVYDFIVNDAIEGQSKAGNEMITLKLLVDMGGRQINMTDWIVLLPSDHKSHAFSVKKIKDFLECVNIPYAIDSMEPEKLKMKEGKVLLKLEYNKDKKRNYLKVEMYMTEDLLKKYNHEHQSTESKDFDDDIPF